MASKSSFLCINAGSSSIKFAIYQKRTGELERVVRGDITNILHAPILTLSDAKGQILMSDRNLNPGYHEAIEQLLDCLEPYYGDGLLAVGHRVVHGGSVFTEPVLISQAVIDQLKALIPLAPLHQPYHIQAIEAISRRQPDIKQIACFDTAFHRTMNRLNATYPIPQEWTDKGLVRYGFHGLSYDYISQYFAEKTKMALPERTIVAHLGNGASICAMHGGKSVATSMGFTPLQGVMMGTRSGTVDPGLIFHLIHQEGMASPMVEDMLLNHSGLQGVSGISHDMKTLIESSDPKAQFAIDLYCYRLAQEIAACIPVLGGLDAVVFTAGVGEKCWQVREKVCDWLEWMGIEINAEANRQNQVMISTDHSKVEVFIVSTDEERMIVRCTAEILRG